jgi:hypothetical protein
LCRHKSFEEALNAVKFLGWLKKFGPAQNILGPVKGQGIRVLELDVIVLPTFSDIEKYLRMILSSIEIPKKWLNLCFQGKN